ncbi:hypothetical protein TNIN_12891 [Trichonephila inaurata madagascariensis]|uniref:Uncharacterized protein n=1 Tax=Trichonephila inaurata madagascariensis TaxID=2747483 RepID=A0A8X7CQT9_9ARAC|nr:hypothetical protein TNIN_12891 [Trichonephila inaurata madagascariensis]
MITFRRLQQRKKNKRILQLWREKNAEQTAKKKRKKQVNITRMFVQQSKCPSRFRTTQRVANARIKMESETQKENVWREIELEEAPIQQHIRSSSGPNKILVITRPTAHSYSDIRYDPVEILVGRCRILEDPRGP